MELVGGISIAFDLISSEYGWDDEVILNKSLRRLRQIIAVIGKRRKENLRVRRQELSWQTRNLAMVCAAAGSNASEELMKFAANLTIDNEEYEQFEKENGKVISSPKSIPVHASTQEKAVEKNFEAAADRNSFDMLALFGMSVEKAPPGQ